MLGAGSMGVEGAFAELETEAWEAFREMGAVPVMLRSADLRYRGQGYELRVDWGPGAMTKFHQLHARAYGYADASRAVEIVTLRVQAVARARVAAPVKGRKGDGKRALVGSHRVFESGRWRRASLYERAKLRSGDRVAGPAVLVELSATTYLPGGWMAMVDVRENLVLTRGSKP